MCQFILISYDDRDDDIDFGSGEMMGWRDDGIGWGGWGGGGGDDDTIRQKQRGQLKILWFEIMNECDNKYINGIRLYLLHLFFNTNKLFATYLLIQFTRLLLLLLLLLVNN